MEHKYGQGSGTGGKGGCPLHPKGPQTQPEGDEAAKMPSSWQKAVPETHREPGDAPTGRENQGKTFLSSLVAAVTQQSLGFIARVAEKPQ